MSRVEQLRSEYPEFRYSAAAYSLTTEGFSLDYVYQVGDVEYRHTVHFPGITEQEIAKIPTPDLQTLAEHIGMIEAFSYWKATCSPVFQVTACSLNTEQLAWWHNLLINGMGEFFYVNQIDFTASDFVCLKSKGEQQSSQIASTPPDITQDTRILIPVGGGKDSVVTLELLSANRHPHTLGCLLINPTQAALDTAKLSGIPNLHIVERKFDQKLKLFTQEKGLNGHVPVSASFAWISLLAARLHGYQLIALSNEASSNEGSAEFHGRIINHQYSKTYAFEQSLQEYVSQWLAPGTPWYFSLLRPLHELQIAKLFAKHTKYHQAFRSCNRGQKTNSWCCDCPKCLFAYLILSPFLPQSRLAELLGRNVLDNTKLLPELKQLLGIVPQKPLECVGTRAESLAATHLTIKKLQAENQPLPSLLQTIRTEPLLQQPDLPQQAEAIRISWNQHHSIPSALAQLLEHTIQEG